MDSNENSRLSRVAKRREEESRNNPRKPNKNSGLVKKDYFRRFNSTFGTFCYWSYGIFRLC